MAFLVLCPVAKVCSKLCCVKKKLQRYVSFTECNCNVDGTESCIKETGQCICKPNVVGEKCDACKDGYYGYLPNCLPCPKGWIGPTIKQKCYHISSISMNYFEAKEKCESMASKLAEPRDSTEDSIISEAMIELRSWIGINDLQQKNE